MARTIYSDSKGKYIIVKNGDTLSELTVELKSESGGKTQAQLQALNNITHPKLWVFTGDKFYITGTGKSGSGTKATSSKELKIDGFGLSAADPNQKTLFAVWSCKLPKIASYKYEWNYTTGDKTNSGDDVWFKGSNGDLQPEETNCSYTIPSGAKVVRFRVKPMPTEEKVQSGRGTQPSTDMIKYLKEFVKTGSFDGTTTYKSFSDRNWTYSEYHYVTPMLPSVPSPQQPEIDHKTNMLKVEIHGYPVQDALNAGVDRIDKDGWMEYTWAEFQVVVNDTSELVTESAWINQYGDASWAYPITPGNKYKVRCRALRDVYKSEWSAFTTNVSSAPEQVTGLKATAIRSSIDGKINFYLEWNPSGTAEQYKIEYLALSPGEDVNFDTTNATVSSITTKDATTTYTITDVPDGKVYYFRIAATNSKSGDSIWSEVLGDITVGQKPGSPYTWSSANTISLGEDVYLYWEHNPKDGSKEYFANILVESYIYDDKTKTEVVVGREDILATRNEDSVVFTYDFYEVVNGKNKHIWSGTDTVSVDKDQTSYYKYETNHPKKQWLEEGVTLRYSVQTAGITGEFGDWSDTGYINVYAPASLAFTVKPQGSDIAYNSYFTCRQFPLTINAVSGPKTQSPTGYYVSIVSNDIYETVDNIGRNKTVSAGDTVYSKYFDVNNFSDRDINDFKIGPSDVNLENGITYTIECTVYMNSGLSANHAINFMVLWSDEIYTPLAQVMYNSDTYTVNIRPYCEDYKTYYYAVTKSGLEYKTTSDKLNDCWGVPLRLANGSIARTSDTNDVVYTGVTTDLDGNYIDGEQLFYEVNEGTLIPDVTLSVYRREYDGGFTEIATGIDNVKNTFVTDPHPSLDYARYRIVAMSNKTGAIGYSDIPGIPILEPGIIIQWDEEWDSYDYNFDVIDEPSKPSWSGSLLRLPYNVDVSTSHNIDTAFVEYIGREHPVSYYGTQLGETATWNTAIPKEDKETLYALRRLSRWTGNVYAREPSGVGYWAHISVQFPQKHLDKTIAVSISLTRVEGGM